MLKAFYTVSFDDILCPDNLLYTPQSQYADMIMAAMKIQAPPRWMDKA